MFPAPKKPFPSYKWRWATVTCTEGLNDPAVYLGVLRALDEFEGQPPSNRRLFRRLQIVEKQTNSRVTLARAADRNLIRNSGQYWTALGLLAPARGEIRLTEFGKKVADGNITPIEFAISVIVSLELPNRQIMSPDEVLAWGDLRIKPLRLILDILDELRERFGQEHSYLTRDELTRIVIPLAGIRSSLSQFTTAINLYRTGKLDMSTWPDCTPGANDKRIAREFLLFLANYGFCKRILRDEIGEERFYLEDIERRQILEIREASVEYNDSISAYEEVVITEVSSTIERKKVMRAIWTRPYQLQFRENVLQAFKATCIITKVNMPNVLEAAHIVPVAEKGLSLIGNSLCMRVDVHRLFDTGHLRIDPMGRLHLSDTAAKKNNYLFLPKKITLPSFVSRKSVDWRWRYM